MKRNSGPHLTKDQAKLLRFWVSKCAGESLPERRDISPAELVFCLPYISIVEHRSCGSYVFRLTASVLREMLGEECRGQTLSDVCGKAVPWCEAISQSLNSKSPVFGATPTGFRKAHYWMRLPLKTQSNGHTPVLCYDRVQVCETDRAPECETMFVTANAFGGQKRESRVVTAAA